MKKSILIALFGVLAMGQLLADFGPGGVSVDFFKYSGVIKEKATGNNILQNGSFENPDTELMGERNPTNKREGQYWDGCSYVHMDATAGDPTALRNLLRQLCRRETVKSDGKQNARLINPPELAAGWENPVRISNRIRQRVAIPVSAADEKYELSFKLRGKAYSVPGWNHPMVFIHPGKNPPEQSWVSNGTTQSKTFTFSPDWQQYSVSASVPPGTASLLVDFALYGIGEMEVDDVVLFRSEFSEQVGVRQIPTAYFDPLYVVGENQAAALLFAMNSEKTPDKEHLRFALCLPDGFKVLDYRREHPLAEVKKQADGSSIYYFDLKALPPSAFRDYLHWQGISLLIESEHPASDKLYQAQYYTEQNKIAGEVKTFNFKIEPAVTGKRPKNFRTGGMFTTDFNFTGPGIVKAAKLYLDSGFNSYHGANRLFSYELKKHGIFRYQQIFNIANGFRIGGPDYTEEAKFRLVTGEAWAGNICPVEVYQQGKYYREKVTALLEQELIKDDITDNVMSNWEPYMFDFRGCFCVRCRDEFIRHTKLPAEEIKALWPEKIIATHKAAWEKFRSYQHGQLVIQLEKTINEIGKKHGKESHFLPEIAYRCVTERNNQVYGPQYNPLDFMAELPWLVAWGPYVYHSVDQEYQYTPTKHMLVYTTARQVKEFAGKHTKSIPNLVSMPLGFLDNPDWFTEPEALSFEFLCYFVQGWQGAFGYYFPRGADYRYYRAMADANTLIADHEDFVAQGKDISGEVQVTPETPIPENLFYPDAFAESKDLPGALPGLHQEKLLQYKAFRLNDKVLVAVGNFWQKGEVFFKMQVPGLNAAARYRVSVPGVNCGEFTGRELAAGILLQVGALRWQLAVIEPAGGGNEKAFSQQQMRQLLAERTPSINSALEWEKNYYRKYQAVVLSENPGNNYESIKPVSQSEVTLTAHEQILRISTPSYSLDLVPEKGAKIVNYRHKNDELFDKNGDFGLAVDGFWYPEKAVCQILSGYRIENIGTFENGVEVRLSRIITRKDNVELAGLKLIKNFKFTSDKIAISTTVWNILEDGIRFSFRFHCMPAFLGEKKQEYGKAVFGDGTEFKRELVAKLYRFGEEDRELEKIFPMNRTFTIKSSEVVFSAPWSSTKLYCKIPAGNLQCIVFWDDGKDPASTFEPIFKRKLLAPGEQVVYSMEWSAK